jgi:hypothetical protein
MLRTALQVFSPLRNGGRLLFQGVIIQGRVEASRSRSEKLGDEVFSFAPRDGSGQADGTIGLLHQGGGSPELEVRLGDDPAAKVAGNRPWRPHSASRAQAFVSLAIEPRAFSRARTAKSVMKILMAHPWIRQGRLPLPRSCHSLFRPKGGRFFISEKGVFSREEGEPEQFIEREWKPA